MNANPETVVRQFLSDMGRPGGLIKAIENHCAEGCRWENTGLPTAENKAAMVTMMKAFIDGYQLDHMVVELTAIAAAGDKVLTERVDHLKKADGTLILSIALAGVLHVRDGRVTHWADYFDPRPFLPS